MRLWWLLRLVIPTCALIPGRLPNGQSKKFTPHPTRPASDLKSVEPHEVVFLMKHWTNNIEVNHHMNKEDKHILKRINSLASYIQLDKRYPCVYLIWIPNGYMYEVLFILLIHVNENPRVITPCILIQSPFWDSSQIESIELKHALIDLANQTNRTLNLDPLYQNDPRYRLAWNFR